MGKSALQREMDSFFKDLNNTEFSIRKVTKGAFSKSRRNLKPEAFLELNKIVCDDFYETAPYLTYNNHRILAIDGSTFGLPNHPEIEAEFGKYNSRPGDREKSMAKISMLFDPVNYMTLDIQIGPYNAVERDQMLNHLEKVNPGDLLLMDRGYPSSFLFAILQSKGIQFCIRLKNKQWKEIEAFVGEDVEQKEVEFALSAKNYKKYKEKYPEIQANVRCRLIKVQLENGLQEILCTSLMDKQAYPIEDFKDLYHLRWGEEEGYKMYKSRVNIEAFSGKTAIAVKQDIFAKVFMMSYCAAYAFPIEEKVRKEYQQSANRKHPQKINRTNAVSYFRKIIISLLLKQDIDESIKAFDDNVFRTREIIRPNRTIPRKNNRKRPYHMGYKDL